MNTAQSLTLTPVRPRAWAQRPLDRPDQARAHSAPGRGILVWLLAAMPPLDMAVAQVQALLDPHLGPLSLAQAFHGVVLLGLAGILAARAGSFPRRHRTVLSCCGIFGLGLLFSVLNNLTMQRLAFQDIVAVLQVVYWLLLWPAAIVICRTPRQWQFVLLGMAVAGVYAALSVLYFRLTGQTDALPYGDVAASAGGLNTAKGLGGILIMAALAGAFLARNRRRWLGLGCCCLCLAALFLTYQRAGLVAAIAGLAWLAGWWLLKAMGHLESAWLARMLLASIVAGAAILLIVGTADLQTRWADLDDPEKAGSARVSFWQVAVSHYAGLSLPDKLCGVGYSGLIDAMQAQHGQPIHAHSDLLDVLAMFGLIGAAGLAAVHVAILRVIGSASRSAWAAACAAWLVLLIQSLLTGQMFGPHVMAAYLLTITGIAMSGQRAAGGGAPGRLNRIAWPAVRARSAPA